MGTCLLVALGPGTASTARAAPCDPKTVERVRAPVTPEDSVVKLACDLSLLPGDVIQKQLVFEGPRASGTTLSCRGARLVGGRGKPRHSSVIIRAKRKRNGDYRPPAGITIRDCRIEGGVRIHGMGDGGRDRQARASSFRPGHTARSRAAGPRQIRLERLHLQAVGPIPLYIAQGVTGVTLVDSLVTGECRSVAVYLDAESGHNTLRRNIFLARSERRETIAIDGSSHNLIAQNLFSTGPHGGIYLYRNCGERGTVRHNRPTHNRIVQNTFVYADGDWGDPAVFFGSRDAAPGYCDEDDGHGLGSGDSDLDYARDNVVTANVFDRRPLEDALRTQRPRVNGPNDVFDNSTVDRLALRPDGSLACLVGAGGSRAVVPSGQTLKSVVTRGGHAVCRQQRCQDGQPVDIGACDLQSVPLRCLSAPGSRTCQTTARCPAGSRPLAAMAACDFGSGASLDGALLRALPPGLLTVVRGGNGGACSVGRTRVERLHGTVSVGSGPVPVQCRAADDLPGCAVQGVLFCVPAP